MAYSNVTKTAMAEAMKALMAEMPFSRVSVGDICERCGMNRKSFYYHFKDKYDLVNWIFQTEFLEVLNVQDYTSGWGLIADLCAYFYKERAFYAAALRIEGQNSFSDFFSAALNAILPEVLRDPFETPEDSRFFFDFFTDAIKTAITRWLTETPPVPPEVFTERLRKTVDSR